MFQFPGFPTYTYVFSIRSMVLHHGSFLIRKSVGRSLFAAYHGLSQLVTSFIGSWCQGIRLMLLFAWTFLLAISRSLGSLRSLELLEFHKTFFRLFLLFAVKRLFFLLCIDFTSTFRWNCITLPYFYRKTYTNLLIFVLFVCSFFLLFNLFLLLFGFQWSISCLLP